MNQIFRWLETWFGTFQAATATAKPNFKNGFQVNGSDYTATELNTALGGGNPGTAGTVTASKAVIVDANKDIAIFRNLSAVNLDAGASGTVGTVDIFPTTASKGKIQIAAADSAGDTTTTITNASQAAARTYTIPDAGANASFVMTAGNQSIAGDKTFTGSLVATATVLIQRVAGSVASSLQLQSITAAKGGLVILAADNTGDTNTTITSAPQAAGRTYTIPDATTKASIDAAEFVMLVRAAGAPSGVAAAQGTFYQNSSNGDLYMCTTGSATSATFKQVTMV